MKLTTKLRYGMRALIRIAENENGFISTNQITDLENIPVPFLEQILGKLVKRKIITSRKGPNGGYRLARDPAKISLKDIFDVLEGKQYLIRCINERQRSCRQQDICDMRIVWRGLADAMKEFMGSISLKDILDEKCDIGEEC